MEFITFKLRPQNPVSCAPPPMHYPLAPSSHGRPAAYGSHHICRSTIPSSVQCGGRCSFLCMLFHVIPAHQTSPCGDHTRQPTVTALDTIHASIPAPTASLGTCLSAAGDMATTRTHLVSDMLVNDKTPIIAQSNFDSIRLYTGAFNPRNQKQNHRQCTSARRDLLHVSFRQAAAL
jgi:hypothetical protein